MGLKDEIFEAFVGSIQPDNPGEDFIFSDAGVNKIDTLAEELSAAIQKFILAQDFKVDKLSAPVFLPTLSATPILPIPAVGPPGAPLIQLLTPMKLQGTAPGVPLIDTTADVDINGQAANGSLLGKSASDNSLVKLRSVKKDTG